MQAQKIKIEDLEDLANERIKDAKVLCEAGRYFGAVYICGYALELGLKKQICCTLGWDEYPTESKYKSLKTHDLEVLLHFSGKEKLVIANLQAQWSIVLQWNPEARYSASSVMESQAKHMIEATEAILGSL